MLFFDFNIRLLFLYYLQGITVYKQFVLKSLKASTLKNAFGSGVTALKNRVKGFWGW